MVLGNGVRIIWLDTYIGQNGNCQALKQQFENALQPLASMPPDQLNVTICALEETDTTISFVDTPAEALQLIEKHSEKQIIFISSGSLGQYILPLIMNVYTNVYRFYLFCTVTSHYIDFAMNYGSCLQIFNHEIDLLIQLIRDISSDVIAQGQIYMRMQDTQCALKCFEQALELNLTANEINTFNSPCLKSINELIADHGNNGLIQQAKDLLNQ